MPFGRRSASQLTHSAHLLLYIGLASLAACGGGVVPSSPVATPPSSPATPTPPAITGTEVNFTTAAPLTLPSRSSFSGANMQIFSSGVSYLDTAMQSLANSLHLGWTRFPAGTADDYYDWTTGSTPYAWASQFSSYNSYSIVESDEQIVGGKGGIRLADYGSFLATQRTGPAGATGTSPTQTIGVINTFTDTAQSAGNLALAAKNAGISVAVWELGNETSLFPGFYPTAADYLNDVKPYAQAIKAAVPAAKVAVWIPYNTSNWTQEVAAYPTPFWDELYTHSYPTATQSTTAEQMEYYNGFLANNTNELVDTALVGLFGNNMQIEWSEFNINTLEGTLYNALYVAELTLRLASDPHVTNVGMHMLFQPKAAWQVAISPTNDHVTDCKNACAWSSTLHQCTGTPIDTSQLSFGYFMTPAALAMEIVNGDINTSEGLWPTTVTNSPTVATIINSSNGIMPAIYAQAFEYQGTTKHVLLTNKASSAQTVTITENGSTLPETLTTSSIGGTDPAAMNTATDPANVQIVTGTANTTVTVPAYGVMDVSWTE